MTAPVPDAVTVLAPPIVGIGASAGGLEALRDLLGAARMPTGLALVIVQHLDPNHESLLAQLLDRCTDLEVLQCEGGERLEADRVYIIPPGRGLAVHDGVLMLTDFAQPRGLRRPIDDFFISLSTDQQANAACVILSGTGADGTTGLRAIKENGGVCVVQEPTSARYDGMPLSAVGTGLVDFVKPPAEILACLGAFFARRQGRGDDDAAAQQAEVVADHVDALCRVLKDAIGHDFSGYKRSTLVRRVERRMHVLGLATGSGYLARVRSSPGECEALFRDLLINVTRFFRDPELFEVLRARAIAPLVAERAADEDLRVWISGCSSGEEAYSIAMLFAEVFEAAGQPLAVQIFATDIDEQMLQIAREGTYPNAAMADIPARLRDRYTIPHAERFTIVPAIRDVIRFSNHSLVKDPPFSRIDLASCRNLLIYFDERLQQMVLPLLHYAVRANGFLFLGPSETIGRFDSLFRAVDGNARLFQRAPGAPRYPIELPGEPGPAPARRRAPARDRHAPPPTEQTAAQKLLDRYAPPSVVIDNEGAILAAWGQLSRYFDFPVSRAGGMSAFMLARPGLRAVLGPLLRTARDDRRRTATRGVSVDTGFGMQPVDVICDPLDESTALVVFREAGAFVFAENDDIAEISPEDDHLDVLEEELRLTRHRLRSTVEELETANEELKSSNEEMMSMNEELQSTNEELTTVNDELKAKVEQLSSANADLRNFFETTALAVVVLDADLRVRNYTEAATAIFPLQPADRGRPLADVTSRLADDRYLDEARGVMAGGASVQRQIRTIDGQRTFAMRVLPYRGSGGMVDGATLLFADVTEALALEGELASERGRLDLALRAGRIGIWEFRRAADTVALDAVCAGLLGRGGAGMRPSAAIVEMIAAEDRAGVCAAVRHTRDANDEIETSFRIRSEDGQRWIKAIGRIAGGAPGSPVVGVAIDVTAEYTLAETRELMLREMNHRVKNLFAVIGSMIGLAARRFDTVDALAQDMRSRIAALGAAHALAATDRDEDGVDLAELVRTTLEPYREAAAVTIEGPAVAVRQRCISPIALILHEWATNSVKYGALRAQDGGRITVAWHWGPGGLMLEWGERRGPADHAEALPAPPRSGFGTLMVEASVRQLGGELTRPDGADGFAAALRLPVEVFADD